MVRKSKKCWFFALLTTRWGHQNVFKKVSSRRRRVVWARENTQMTPRCRAVAWVCAWPPSDSTRPIGGTKRTMHTAARSAEAKARRVTEISSAHHGRRKFPCAFRGVTSRRWASSASVGVLWFAPRFIAFLHFPNSFLPYYFVNVSPKMDLHFFLLVRQLLELFLLKRRQT